MYSLKHPWKPFKIHLPALDLWMKSSSPKYIGMSAGNSLTLHFSEEPSQVTKDRIQMYLDAAKEESELEKVATDEKRQKAKKAAIAAIPSCAWDSMIPAERKLVMQMPLSVDDLDELVKKHVKE